MFNLEQERQLSLAVKSARQAFVDNFELLCPRFPDEVVDFQAFASDPF